MKATRGDGVAHAFDRENRLVHFRTGLELADAQMLKSVLEAAGIDVFLNSEHMASLMGQGVKADLMVRASDMASAEALLTKVAAMPRRTMPYWQDIDGEDHDCDQCGSTRVHPFEGKVPTFIPGVYLAAEKGDGWFHCLQCDSYFNSRRSRFPSMSIAFIWSVIAGAAALCLYWFIGWLAWL